MTLPSFKIDSQLLSGATEKTLDGPAPDPDTPYLFSVSHSGLLVVSASQVLSYL